MVQVDARREDGQLIVVISGVYGRDAQNSRSGRAVKEVLEQYCSDQSDRIGEVLLDYTHSREIGGDGPLWSLRPAISRKIPVRCLACGNEYEWLAQSVAICGLEGVVQVDEVKSKGGRGVNLR